MLLHREEQLLKKHFPLVSAIAPKVFKAVHSVQNKIVAFYFFDFSDELLQPNFNLKSYQDRLLADDYFQADGSLQWNFYLYFVCEDQAYRKLSMSDLVNIIETDKDYARKIVTSKTQLERELQVRTPVPEVDKTYPDISLKWVEKLRSKQLDGVYMTDIPKLKVVEQYMKGQPIREAKVPNATQRPKGRTKLDYVKHIRLDDYRPFPHLREFEFGKCNLIEGANGSGKTSLLEALELWMCGATLRDLEVSYNSRIGLLFEGSNAHEWNYNQSDPIHRRRDWEWYGNHYSAGNKLCFGFNRFNFFNTDAAVKLELGGTDDDKNILDALSDLVLGPTATMIDERASAILGLFSQQMSLTQKEIELLEAEIKESENEIDTLRRSKESEDTVQKTLISLLKRIKWQGAIPTNSEKSLNKFAENISQLRGQLRRTKDQADWLKTFDAQRLRKEQTTVKRLLTAVEKSNKKAQKLVSSVAQLEQLISSNARLVDLMKEYKPYTLTDDLSAIPGLENAIADRFHRLQVYQEISTEISGIDLKSWLEITERVVVFEKTLRKKIDSYSSRMRQLQSLTDSAQASQDEIEAFMKELRCLTPELRQRPTDRTDCPVCGIEYKRSELLYLLLKRSTRNDNLDALLRDRISGLGDIRIQVEHLVSQSSQLLRLKTAYAMITHLDSSVRIREMVASLSQLVSQTPKIAWELGNLRALRSRLNRQGLSERRFQELRELLREIDYKFPLGPADSGKFESKLTRSEASLAKAKSTIKELRRQLLKEQALKDRLLGSYFKEEVIVDPEKELTKRESILVATVKTFAESSKYLKVASKTKIDDLINRLDEIQTGLDQVWQSKKLRKESVYIRNRSERRIRRARKKLQKAKTRNSLAQVAVETLNNLLGKDGKEQHLNAFLRENMREIGDTFRQIHSPREFSLITFDERDKRKIILTKEHGQTVPISRISSGQRTALALSLFLTLNRKLVQGPPFLIFDDPVAYIDDLNALSFFDYLRDIIIKSNRQLFFTTSNEKMGYLFRKKFDFLGEDSFRWHRLSRT